MTTTETSTTSSRGGLRPRAGPFIAEPRRMNVLLALANRAVEREMKQRFVPGRLLGWSPRSAVAALSAGWLLDHPDALVPGRKDRPEDKRILDLVVITASYAAGSPYCVAMNLEPPPTNLSTEELEALSTGADVSEVPSFGHRERLAIRYARMISATPLGFPDDLIAELNAAFTEREIVILASTAAAVNYEGRLIEALGPPAPVFEAEPTKRASAIATVPKADEINLSFRRWLDRGPWAPARQVERYVSRGQVAADLGCTEGYYTFALAERVGLEGRVYAVDLNPRSIAAVRKTAEEHGFRNVEAHASDAADLSYIPDRSVDFVLANGLLCSMPYRRAAAVAEIKRILRPTGRAYLRLGVPSPVGFVDRAEWEEILGGFTVERRGGRLQRWAEVSRKDPGAEPAEHRPRNGRRDGFRRLRMRFTLLVQAPWGTARPTDVLRRPLGRARNRPPADHERSGLALSPLAR